MTAVMERTYGAGVHDIPEAIYHSDPVDGGSLSCSGAKKLLPPSCPALFKYEKDHGQPFKKAFEFGSAAHALVLGTGPELVPFAGTGKNPEAWQKDDDKAKIAAIRQRGGIPLKPSEFATVQAMARKLREHPIASALLTPEGGKAEQTLVWADSYAGIMCRSLVDWLPGRNGNRLILADYKGLSLDTQIPTPLGWTTMGTLRVGDEVFDSAGKACRVVGKSEVHWRRCFRMTFDDGSTVICDDEHRWFTVAGRTSCPDSGVRTTDEIRKTLRFQGQRHHRVPVAPALDLPTLALPVDPYVLGCWLGDGNASSGRITKPDNDLFEQVAARGYRVGPGSPSQKCPTRTVYGLVRDLRRVGVLNNKHIPDVYLRASVIQRLDLLRGLMDTDGSWNSTRGQAVFVSTDKAMAHAVRELACSLGQRAIIHTIEARGFGLVVEAYHVTFSPIGGLNPFLLPRKADLVKAADPRRAARSTRRVVVSVEEVPTVPTQCIQVDSPDNTYLCTDSMIPTHNTSVTANPEAFRKSAYEYGYDMQNAWYLDGIRALGLDDDPDFVFVVQMKTAPYLVSLVRLDDEALRVGAERNRKARRIFADCQESDVWPGFTDFEIAEVSLPSYAVYQHDNFDN